MTRRIDRYWNHLQQAEPHETSPGGTYVSLPGEESGLFQVQNSGTLHLIFGLFCPMGGYPASWWGIPSCKFDRSPVRKKLA